MPRGRVVLPLWILVLQFTAGAWVNAQGLAGQATTRTGAEPSSLTFTKNMGQWPDSILYRTDAGGATVWFTATGVIYQFTRRIERPSVGQDPRGPDMTSVGRNPRGFDTRADRFDTARDSIETMLVQASFVDANPDAVIIPEGLTEYKCNYFLGNNPARWRTDVPNYRRIAVKEMHPGVDVVFHGERGSLECEFVASSDSALANVRVEYHGAQAVSIRQDHSATLTTNLGVMVFSGIVPEFASTPARRTATSTVAPEGASLKYSTYLGGGSPDYGYGIAVDRARCAYVAGYTYSSNFPTQNPYDGSLSSTPDVFVSKLSATGSGLVYSTYLGGVGVDAGVDIAVDSSGYAYVTGLTTSSDFPIRNAYDGSLNGSGDVFVTKLTAAGNGLVYSTLIGGSAYDEVRGIAIDNSGNTYVTGGTYSSDFPMQDPFDDTISDTLNAFVCKLAAAGNALLYSTYLGGGSLDYGYGIAVDGSGCAYVTGHTSSPNFPTLNAYDLSLNGGYDAFVTKLSASGSSLDYSTYLGGGNSDYGRGIAVDDSRCAYVTGHTSSSNFPTQNPYDMSHNGGTDGFVTKFSVTGNVLLYSTYLGGAYDDEGTSIAIVGAGDVCVSGQTNSLDFPMQKPFDSSYNGGAMDAFVIRLSTVGNGLLYSSYIGGEATEETGDIVVDDSGYAYVTGYTNSSDFPTEAPYDGSANGEEDAFVAKLATVACCSGVTGNVNLVGIVDLSDLSALVSYLTGGGYVLPCPEEANVNSAGIVDLSDLSALVSYLTGFGYVLPNCP